MTLIWKRNREFNVTVLVCHSRREIIRTATMCFLQD